MYIYIYIYCDIAPSWCRAAAGPGSGPGRRTPRRRMAGRRAGLHGSICRRGSSSIRLIFLCFPQISSNFFDFHVPFPILSASWGKIREDLGQDVVLA